MILSSLQRIISFIQLPFIQYKCYRSRFCLNSILFINPAYMCRPTSLFSLFQLLLNKNSFITPTYIYALLFLSFLLLFKQYYFHHSSFYFYCILFIIKHPLNTISFITPTSIYVVLFSFIQLPFTQYSFYRFHLIKILPSLQILFIQYCFHHSSYF